MYRTVQPGRYIGRFVRTAVCANSSDSLGHPWVHQVPIAVNGADIITCDDEGMITEFKVIIRPFQAVALVHAQMKAMLERLSG